MKHLVLINNSHIENFSVRNIAAFLKQKGYKVSTVHYEGKKDDVFNLLPQKALDALAVFCKGCDLVGISLLTTHLLSRSIQITEHLKKENSSRIIWGGVPVICSPGFYLQFADYICAAEGEQLLADLLDGRPVKKINGLGYLSKTGEPVINPLPDFIDLNSQPLPRLDMEDGYLLDENGLTRLEEKMPKSLSTYSVLSVRGCPYQCSYCLNSRLINVFRGRGNYIRKIRTSRVIEELVWAKKHIFPLKRIVIDDDDFFLRSCEEMDELLREYSEKIGLPIFYIQAHARHITREKAELFKKHNINLRYLKIGLQSGSTRISREIFNRPLDKELFLDRIRLLVKNRIRIMIDLISDNPYETFEDKYEALVFYQEILKIAKAHASDDLPMKIYDHKLMYYPGARLYDRVLNDGHIGPDYIENVLLKRNTLRKKNSDIDTEALLVGLFNLAVKKNRYSDTGCRLFRLLKVKPLFFLLVRFDIVRKFSILKRFDFFNRFIERINRS